MAHHAAADPHAAHGGHDGPPEIHTWVNVICVGVVVIAFLFSVGAVWQFVHSGLPHFEKVVYTWLGDDSGKWLFPTYSGKAAEFKAEAGFLLDPLSSIWLLFVTGVGMLIHIYSTGYMAHDRRVLPLLRLPEPVHVLHADAHPGEQLLSDVRRLGRGRSLLVPADRLLLPEALGIDGG